jgi:hydroxymethylbilane synthase
MSIVRIGTRGSDLARYQAHAVAARLREQAGVAADLVVIRTSGDRLADAPLSQIGGKRLFVKEIEEALLSGEVDLAVHSSKDMPALLPEGLVVGAALPRADARDAVVRPGGVTLADPASIEPLVRTLGREPRIGTSSVRRIAQLMRVWPAARFAPVRGNLDTRLRKLDAGEYDALVLASAGLLRLDRADRISAALPVDICVPAPGQGIVAVEVRRDDARMRGLVARIDDPPASTALSAERALVARLGGGCQMPLGAYASLSGTVLSLHAVVVSLDGTRIARAHGEHDVRRAPEDLGREVGERLLDDGAGDILAAVERAQASVEGLQP